MTLSDPVQWALLLLTGSEWPDGDPDQVRQKKERWDDAAAGLVEVRDQFAGLAGAGSGSAADTMARASRELALFADGAAAGAASQSAVLEGYRGQLKAVQASIVTQVALFLLQMVELLDDPLLLPMFPAIVAEGRAVIAELLAKFYLGVGELENALARAAGMGALQGLVPSVVSGASGDQSAVAALEAAGLGVEGVLWGNWFGRVPGSWAGNGASAAVKAGSGVLSGLTSVLQQMGLQDLLSELSGGQVSGTDTWTAFLTGVSAGVGGAASALRGGRAGHPGDVPADVAKPLDLPKLPGLADDWMELPDGGMADGEALRTSGPSPAHEQPAPDLAGQTGEELVVAPGPSGDRGARAGVAGPRERPMSDEVVPTDRTVRAGNQVTFGSSASRTHPDVVEQAPVNDGIGPSDTASDPGAGRPHGRDEVLPVERSTSPVESGAAREPDGALGHLDEVRARVRVLAGHEVLLTRADALIEASGKPVPLSVRDALRHEVAWELHRSADSADVEVNAHKVIGGLLGQADVAHEHSVVPGAVRGPVFADPDLAEASAHAAGRLSEWGDRVAVDDARRQAARIVSSGHQAPPILGRRPGHMENLAREHFERVRQVVADVYLHEGAAAAVDVSRDLAHRYTTVRTVGGVGGADPGLPGSSFLRDAADTSGPVASSSAHREPDEPEWRRVLKQSSMDRSEWQQRLEGVIKVGGVKLSWRREADRQEIAKILASDSVFTNPISPSRKSEYVRKLGISVCVDDVAEIEKFVGLDDRLDAAKGGDLNEIFNRVATDPGFLRIASLKDRVDYLKFRNIDGHFVDRANIVVMIQDKLRSSRQDATSMETGSSGPFGPASHSDWTHPMSGSHDDTFIRGLAEVGHLSYGSSAEIRDPLSDVVLGGGILDGRPHGGVVPGAGGGIGRFEGADSAVLDEYLGTGVHAGGLAVPDDGFAPFGFVPTDTNRVAGPGEVHPISSGGQATSSSATLRPAEPGWRQVLDQVNEGSKEWKERLSRLKKDIRPLNYFWSRPEDRENIAQALRVDAIFAMPYSDLRKVEYLRIRGIHVRDTSAVREIEERLGLHTKLDVENGEHLDAIFNRVTVEEDFLRLVNMSDQVDYLKFMKVSGRYPDRLGLVMAIRRKLRLSAQHASSEDSSSDDWFGPTRHPERTYPPVGLGDWKEVVKQVRRKMVDLNAPVGSSEEGPSGAQEPPAASHSGQTEFDAMLRDDPMFGLPWFASTKRDYVKSVSLTVGRPFVGRIKDVEIRLGIDYGLTIKLDRPEAMRRAYKRIENDGLFHGLVDLHERIDYLRFRNIVGPPDAKRAFVQAVRSLRHWDSREDLGNTLGQAERPGWSGASVTTADNQSLNVVPVDRLFWVEPPSEVVLPDAAGGPGGFAPADGVLPGQSEYMPMDTDYLHDPGTSHDLPAVPFDSMGGYSPAYVGQDHLAAPGMPSVSDEVAQSALTYPGGTHDPVDSFDQWLRGLGPIRDIANAGAIEAYGVDFAALFPWYHTDADRFGTVDEDELPAPPVLLPVPGLVHVAPSRPPGTAQTFLRAGEPGTELPDTSGWGAAAARPAADYDVMWPVVDLDG